MSAPTVDVNGPPEAVLTAVLLHPHPDMGGDRFNHVVDALFQSMPKGGFRAVRFDFSSSDIATATAEAQAVVDHCADDAPIVLVGYSFGAGIAARVTDPRVLGWLLVAPFLSGDVAAAADARPKLLLVPERDQWSPPARVEALIGTWVNATVTTVARADHFLVGATGTVVDTALAWLADLVG